MLAHRKMSMLLLGLAVPAIALASDELQALKDEVAKLHAWKDHVMAELKALKLSQGTPTDIGITGSPRRLNEDAAQVLELSGSSGSAFVSHDSSGLSFSLDSEGNKRLTVGPSKTDLDGELHVQGWVGIGVADNANPYNANLEVQGSGPTKLVIRGDGPGYINSGIVLVSTHSDANYRGGGTYMYDEAADNEWFAGRPYAGSDRFILARQSGMGKHDTSTAQNKFAQFSVDSGGYARMKSAQLDDGALMLGDWNYFKGGHHAGTVLLTAAGIMQGMFVTSHTTSLMVSLVIQGRNSADSTSSSYYSGSWYVNVAYGSPYVGKIGGHTSCCAGPPTGCEIEYVNGNSLGGKSYVLGVKCASFGNFAMAKVHYSITGTVNTQAAVF